MTTYLLPVGDDETARQLLACNGFKFGKPIAENPRWQRATFPPGWSYVPRRSNQYAIVNPDQKVVAVTTDEPRARIHFTYLWRYDFNSLYRKVLIRRGLDLVTTLTGVRDEYHAKLVATQWLDEHHPTWHTSLT